ncbi:MAG: hypothetical protein PVI88_00305 [Nitrosopumilaceae archaeon]
MKKIIFVLLLFISTNAFSYQGVIPGWLEFNAGCGRYYEMNDHNTVGTIDLKIKYGTDFKYFSPYFYGGLKSWFYPTDGDFLKNSPYYEQYTYGIGVTFLDFFFIEVEHMCGHIVVSSIGQYYVSKHVYYFEYEEKPAPITYNKIIVGIRYKID